MEPTERTAVIDLGPAAARMAAVVEAIDEDRRRGPTPCAGTSVGDLVVHVDQVARGAVALAARDVEGMQAAASIVADGSRLGPGWRQEVGRHLRAAAEAWADPWVWDVGAAVPGSDLDAGTWGRITLTELVVHRWDLAVATGQDADPGLPEASLQACWDHVRTFVPAAPFPDLWGPPIDAADAATTFERILAVTGRDAGWRP